MNRPDTASCGSSSAVRVKFDAVLFCLCSVSQLVECGSRADARIDNAGSSGREVQKFSQALSFFLRQRIVT